MMPGGAARDPEDVLAHDWLVVNVEPSSEDDVSLLVVSPLDEPVASVEDEVVVSDVVVAVDATVVVSAPIEPSKATTPQASTNVASGRRRCAGGAGGCGGRGRRASPGQRVGGHALTIGSPTESRLREP